MRYLGRFPNRRAEDDGINGRTGMPLTPEEHAVELKAAAELRRAEVAVDRDDPPAPPSRALVRAKRVSFGLCGECGQEPDATRTVAKGLCSICLTKGMTE